MTSTLHRWMLPVLVVVATSLGSAPAFAITAKTRQCVQGARRAQRTCLTSSRSACRATFATDYATCFGPGADCARACQAEQATCQSPAREVQARCTGSGELDVPGDDVVSCREQQTIDNDACDAFTDVDARRACRGEAALKALACQQRCQAEVQPAFQICNADFSDCVGACASDR